MYPAGWIYVKFDTGDFYKTSSRKCDFGYEWTNTLGILCEDPSTFQRFSNINFPLNCCCATLNSFLLLAVIFSSTVHGEYCHISIATMFTDITQCYIIYVHFLVCFFLFSGTWLRQKWECCSHLNNSSVNEESSLLGWWSVKLVNWWLLMKACEIPSQKT
jgi:hypothetical protein